MKISDITNIKKYYLPEGQTGCLLSLLNEPDFKNESKKNEPFFKKEIRILTSHIQEVEFSHQPNQSHFPIEVNLKTGERTYTNEFSWSRGDLSVLVLLYKTDRAFDENLNKFIADTVGQIVARRKSLELINRNPFIRHGTAGIAQCFLTLFNLSDKGFYKDAYEYWITKTLELLENKTQESNSNNILDSYQGIDLVLETYKTGKNEWSRQILL